MKTAFKIVSVFLVFALIAGITANFLLKPSGSSSDKSNNLNDTNITIPVINYNYPDSRYYDYLFSSTFKGNRYSFDSPEVALPDVSDNSTSIMSVNNEYLQFECASRDKSNFVLYFPDKTELDQTVEYENVLEFDVRFDLTSRNANYNLAGIDLNSDYLSTRIFLYYIYDGCYIQIPRTEYTTSFSGDPVYLALSEWNNLRFVYHVKDNVSYVKLYLNNEFACEFITRHNTNIWTAESFATIGFHNAYSGDTICVDNIYTGYILK